MPRLLSLALLLLLSSALLGGTCSDPEAVPLEELQKDVAPVEHGGRHAAGPFALKLAIYPRDSRFEHEAQLLSLIRRRVHP